MLRLMNTYITLKWFNTDSVIVDHIP
ncbi:TPA: tryptophanase leader peptide [Salmonella enterica subsp. enterica serovar Eastbourne]|nr:tryptophanase leader peptide [Salmonella enterica]EBX5888766.1 tryptophanase leader peptide [Salmonella enterica subsp. enterica serovar Reading]ECA1898162.1 tryptophanase leader peptide [Salmonella enterica subsp. enterica serovar Eastbourne]MLO25868.1 tryptophanase leader peptide [Salmonella enterica subsp. enterica serovar Reading]HDN7459742.1 tryptophanase leader peptide [Salmonella enterica subsp. enterica serovar Eastbourne]